MILSEMAALFRLMAAATLFWISNAAAQEHQILWEILSNPLSSNEHAALLRIIDIAESGKHEKAIRDLDVLVKKKPRTKVYAAAIRGTEYLILGRLPEAAQNLAFAVHELPHNGIARYNYALALLRMGKIDEAELHAREALELKIREAQAMLDVIAKERNRRQTPGISG